jgi:hypothetical protein
LTSDTSDARSLERRVALKLQETTRGDHAGDLAPPVSGPDHRGVRRGILNSTGGAARSTPTPERDRFLESVGALRDWLKHIGRDATWRIALASGFGCVSTQVLLPNDTVLARSLAP